MRTYTLTTMLSCYINTALLLNNSELSGCHPHFSAHTSPNDATKIRAKWASSDRVG